MGRLTVEGIVVAVLSMLLVGTSSAQCPGDNDGSGDVTVDEVVAAVNSALNGCSPVPTPTPEPIEPQGSCVVESGEVVPAGCVPPLRGVVSGIVYAPRGIYAATERWWEPLSLASEAYAFFFNVEPVGSGVEVSLMEVTDLDAADGKFDAAQPVVQYARTNADGIYDIDTIVAEQIDRCRLFLSAGSPRFGDQTRSFVYSNNVNLDPASEAVVRMVLRRIHHTGLQLCDFSPEGLRLITREAENASVTANGANVAEVNDDAYRLVVRDCDVLETIEAVTQRSFNPPFRYTGRPGECVPPPEFE